MSDSDSPASATAWRQASAVSLAAPCGEGLPTADCPTPVMQTCFVAGAEFDKVVKAPGAVALLREFAARLEATSPFEPAVLEQELKTFVAERNLKAGALIHPLRFAVTGRSVGLGLYDALAILGRDRSLARIRRAAAAAG